jgi:hypothetical protein
MNSTAGSAIDVPREGSARRRLGNPFNIGRKSSPGMVRAGRCTPRSLTRALKKYANILFLLMEYKRTIILRRTLVEEAPGR